MRELYLNEAYSYIPHILELLDRSPVSPTYGCFDRNYWHYKATDFPAGMYEEYVLPLALLYSQDLPNNRYYKNERIREYCLAALSFAMYKSHKNGSNDDYYPNEQALGSTAFSLYTCTETYLLLNLEDSILSNFFCERANFIINKKESGTLSNHHALSALTLFNVFLITKKREYNIASERKIEELLSYQSEEGWFKEYEGCDPGYLTFTIDFLAKYFNKNPQEKTKNALGKAIKFCFETVHPDGSYGGEYGSRNTFHFIPAGFELMSKYFPEAVFVRNKFLYSLKKNTRSKTDDDRIFGHYIYNYIQAYLAHDETLTEKERGDYQTYYPEAQLYVYNHNKLFLLCSVAKGGVFKLFRDNKLITSDSGLVATLKNGSVITSHTFKNDRQSLIAKDFIEINGNFYKHTYLLPSPLKQLAFRLLNITIGSYFNRAIRIILQKLLILSKKELPITFTRTIRWENDIISVTDTLENNSKLEIKALYQTTDFTNIYIATSQPFQSATLLPWKNNSEAVKELMNKGKTSILRML